jgi:hypothetical protein
MPVSDLHRQLAAIALGAAGRYGFALRAESQPGRR